VTARASCGIVDGLITHAKGIAMRHLITIGCLLAAIVSYSFSSAAAPLFLLLGFVFEGAFWMRIVRRKRMQ
jgi:hypothetical protein